MIDPRHLQAAEAVFQSLHTPCAQHCSDQNARDDIQKIAQALQRAAQGEEEEQ